MTPTVEDVARDAGVSLGTVSNVINNTPCVREEMRRKVMDSITRLGYVPNEAARRLKSKASNVIPLTFNLGCTLLISRITKYSSPVHFGILEAVRSEALRQRYHMYFEYSTDQLTANPEILGRVNRGNMDGMIFITGTTLTEAEKKFIEVSAEKLNNVVIIGAFRDKRFDRVDIDREQAGFDAVEYLVNMGHRRIAYIGSHNDFDAKYCGYRRGLQTYGIPHDELLVEGGGPRTSMQQGFTNISDILQRTDPRPTAVFASSDIEAISAMNAIKSRGMRIPEDISVISFDNISDAADTVPGLTTMDPCLDRLAEFAVGRLLQKIRNPQHEPVTSIINAKPVLRGSIKKL